MIQNLQFRTSVSGHEDGRLKLRGIDLEELINQADFVSTFFLAVTGKKPKDSESKILNAILVACIDHGIEPASGFVPRVVAASGNDILTAMASTLMALGPYHGGALTPAMEVFRRADEQSEGDIESSVLKIISEYRQQKKRVPGFGHAVYKDFDPRAQQLFLMARKLGVSLKFLDIALSFETLLEQETGRRLVLNIDGAIAALLLALGFDPIAGNGIFALSRVAGSIAHIVEEQKSGNWVRRLDSKDVVHDFGIESDSDMTKSPKPEQETDNS